MSAATRLLALAFSGLVLTVGPAGCGDDPVTLPDALTESEALALFKSITEGLELLPADDMDPGPVDITIPCPLAGQAKIVGTVTAETIADTLRQEVEAVVTPAGCKVSGDAMTFMVNGDPSMRFDMSVDVVGLEKVVIGGRLQGKVKWQLEDRSGDCAMDLPLEATVDLSDPENPRPTGGYKGSMCAHDIELGISLID